MRYGVYFIQNPVTKSVKIGKWSGASAQNRLSDIQIGNEEALRLAAVRETVTNIDAFNLEGTLHHMFKHLRKSGEWFKYDEELGAFIDSIAGNEVPESVKPQSAIELSELEQVISDLNESIADLRAEIRSLTNTACRQCQISRKISAKLKLYWDARYAQREVSAPPPSTKGI